METLKIKNIQVRERQRKDVGDVEDLADSIKRLGLIQPIVVDNDNILLAGERRLTACKQLGWDEISVRRFDELDEIDRYEIELEENIRRKQLEWQDEVQAKNALDLLKRKKYGNGVPGQQQSGWRVKDTARALGESVGNVSMDIQVARAMETFPELKTMSSKTGAYKRYKQLLDNTIRKVLMEDIVNEDRESGVPFQLVHGDCLAHLKLMESASVDLILTDPPYGVSMNTSKVGREYADTFDDSHETFYKLMKQVLPELYRVLKDGGHMYMFYGSRSYVTTIDLIENHSEFNYDTVSNIWYKGRMAGFPYNPKKRFRYSYEPFWFMWKGESRFLQEDVGCVFEIPLVVGSQKLHPAEKPYELGAVLSNLSSLEGEVVLDPFAGSGGLVLAAHHNGRRVIAIEQDDNYYAVLQERFNKPKKEGLDEEHKLSS